MPPPSRILLIRLSHLGDVVQALPVYHALRAAYPGAALAWVAQTEFTDLLRGLPGLERVIAFDRGGGLGAWARLRSDLADFGPDWTVDAQGNSKSALVALASGAPWRTGQARGHWRERFAAGTCTDLVPSPGNGEEDSSLHGVQRALLLARHIARGRGGTGFGADPSDAAGARRDPCLSEDERVTGRRALQAHLHPSRTPDLDGKSTEDHAPALLHLARSSDPRSWPTAYFATLAELLIPLRPVLVLAGPAEEEEAAGLEARGIPVMRQSGLRALAALFAAAAERGGRLVACDSGPAHLAAAVDLPVVLLAGPQDEGLTGPWPLARASTDTPSASRSTGAHRALRVPDLDCAPCRSRTCHNPMGPVCMEDLTPESVVAALDAQQQTLAPPALTP